MEQLDKEKSLVVIPLGALEQHGNQAPLITDTLIASEMTRRISNILSDKKDTLAGNVLFFPVIPIGYSVEHASFCGSITFRPDTYYHVLADIVTGLNSHGFKNFAFLICHGGNRAIAEVVSRQLRRDLGVKIYLITSGAFSSPKVKATLSHGNESDFHGGEMETSMVMAIDESMVDLKSCKAGHYSLGSDKGKLNFFGSLSLPWMGEDFTAEDDTPIGIGGNPSGASAKKGEIILDESANEAANGIIELLTYL